MRAQSGPLADFARKCKAAYQIFFPPRPKMLTPKEEGPQPAPHDPGRRPLRNERQLAREMKTSIVNAVPTTSRCAQLPLHMEHCDRHRLCSSPEKAIVEASDPCY